jgi:hypothetical protein
MNVDTYSSRYGTATAPEEDITSRTIEQQTARVPSTGYLTLALGAMAVSALLKLSNRNDWSLFIGQWAPSLLIIGVYNKLVKQLGSDRQHG